MSKNQLSTSMQLKIIKGITAGMLHLENERLVHRDLAARNILLTYQLDAVVADFGYARSLEAKNSAETKSIIGPIRWMAPECSIERIYSTKSDVWAWGVTMWEIQTGGVFPFKNMTDGNVILQVSGGKIANYLKFPSTTPQRLIDIVTRCWNLNQEERPSFQTISEEVEFIEIDEI